MCVCVCVFEEGVRGGVLFDVTEWTCLIAACAQHGMLKEAQTTLERMVGGGVKEVT